MAAEIHYTTVIENRKERWLTGLRGLSPRRVFAEARKLFNPGPGEVCDYRSGFKLLKLAATLNHLDAHEWLGAAYDYGLGTRANRKLAFKHYKFAADHGGAKNANAEYHVGIFYYGGIGVPRDYRAAVSWLRRAAKHGDATAAHVLGQCYRWGRGVPRDVKLGFKLELQAAQSGDVEGQYAVGLCYSKGEGVVADLGQAFKWYLKAARRGHDYAAHNLARLYETGHPANKRKADFWSKRADELREKYSPPGNKFQSL